MCAGSSDHPLVPLYSVCVLCWISWTMKNWTRQCKRLAFHWHVEDFEEEERERLGFKVRAFFCFFVISHLIQLTPQQQSAESMFFLCKLLLVHSN